MGQKLSPPDMELYRATDEVLQYLWDPIGVAGAPGARDEYYSYLPKVYRLLKDGKNEIEIAHYLNTVQTERMGLATNTEKNKKIGLILLEWKRYTETHRE
jgi:hypothetical protein